MKKLMLIGIAVISCSADATQYDTPSRYAQVPTSCSFNDMILQMCNQQGKSKKLVSLSSQRIYTPGGNKFATADGEHLCVVKGIKGTDPKKYDMTIK